MSSKLDSIFCYVSFDSQVLCKFDLILGVFLCCGRPRIRSDWTSSNFQVLEKQILFKGNRPRIRSDWTSSKSLVLQKYVLFKGNRPRIRSYWSSNKSRRRQRPARGRRAERAANRVCLAHNWRITGA